MKARADRSPRSLQVCMALVFAMVAAGCKDSPTPPAFDLGPVKYTEAGVPYYVNEAGLPFFVSEAGLPYVINEAGAPIYLEAGPVVTEAGIKLEGSVPVLPDALVKKDGWYSTTCKPFVCMDKVTECGDCKDNDGDGKIDSQDPECLGPCDNTEGPALISGVGGVTGSTCHVDCYFDYGNGMGQDTCWWDHQCDPLAPEAPTCLYKPQLVGGKFCPVPQDPACAKWCVPLTPNGCDCFGCCTFPQLPGTYVWIGAKDSSGNGTCTFAALQDKTKCPRCTPVPGCLNPCDKCELCIGKSTLPADCYTVPGTPVKTDAGTTITPDAGVAPTAQCPGGQQPCGLPGQLPCPSTHYCISGCCIFIDLD